MRFAFICGKVDASCLGPKTLNPDRLLEAAIDTTAVDKPEADRNEGGGEGYRNKFAILLFIFCTIMTFLHSKLSI
jgi:hypothetical protein